MFKIIFPEKPAPEKVALAGLWLPFLERMKEKPQLCITPHGFHIQGKSCHVSFLEAERECVIIGRRDVANPLVVSWTAFCARSPVMIKVPDWPKIETSFSDPVFDGVTPAAFMMDMLRHLRFDSEFLAFFDDDENMSCAQFGDFFVRCHHDGAVRISVQGPDIEMVEAAVRTIENMGAMIYDSKPDRRSGKDAAEAEVAGAGMSM